MIARMSSVQIATLVWSSLFGSGETCSLGRVQQCKQMRGQTQPWQRRRPVRIGERNGVSNAALDSRGTGGQEDGAVAVGWKGFQRYNGRQPGPCGRHRWAPVRKRDHDACAGQHPPAGIMSRARRSMAGFSVGGRGSWDDAQAVLNGRSRHSPGNVLSTVRPRMPIPPRCSSGTSHHSSRGSVCAGACELQELDDSLFIQNALRAPCISSRRPPRAVRVGEPRFRAGEADAP